MAFVGAYVVFRTLFASLFGDRGRHDLDRVDISLHQTQVNCVSVKAVSQLRREVLNTGLNVLLKHLYRLDW